MPRPWEDRSFFERESRIDNAFFEEGDLRPESMTVVTGTVVRIEREVRDREILEYISTLRTRRSCIEVDRLLSVEDIE